ncbi:hypothetical protein ACJMK2_011799 [Sinanodonta woodiana]|uniref:Ig-like domain-containing protein n=1 Tax=Sinanodonta woodiana TaxID=1069815 RepID=A0ABD3V8G5_SINWO
MRDSRYKKIFCNGNIDGQWPSAVSHKVNVDVWFQPQKPVVKEFSASFPWVENRTETLHCFSSDYGNPNSGTKWSIGIGIVDTLGHLVIPKLVPDDNGKMVSCELVNSYTSETNTYIVSESISLNVEYSPNIRINTTDSLSVNENQSFNVLCYASGNPSPNQTLWIGKSADNILRFYNISRTATSNYTCEATAASLTHGKLTSQKQLAIIVQYPPHVIVESINGSYTEKGLLIKCSAYGEPEQYAFTLIHSSLYSGIKIRQLSFEYVSRGMIIYQFASPSYMDTGIYTCTVSNGIPDYMQGSIDKSANGTVWIRDIPWVTSIDRNFYAENGHSGRLVIELFSSFLDPQVTWYKHNSSTLNKLQSSEKYNILLSSTLVNVDFYSVTILQPGYIATLEIKNMTTADFGSFQYTLNEEDINTETLCDLSIKLECMKHGLSLCFNALDPIIMQMFSWPTHND